MTINTIGEAEAAYYLSCYEYRIAAPGYRRLWKLIQEKHNRILTSFQVDEVKSSRAARMEARVP